MPVFINIMVRGALGVMAQESMINVYAKLNTGKSNIWAITEEKQRKLKKDETLGFLSII